MLSCISVVLALALLFSWRSCGGRITTVARLSTREGGAASGAPTSSAVGSPGGGAESRGRGEPPGAARLPAFPLHLTGMSRMTAAQVLESYPTASAADKRALMQLQQMAYCR